MDSIFRMLVLLLVIVGIVFFIFAWAKGWLKGAGKGSFTGQAIVHDWANQSKQNAIEYVIDKEEEKKKKDALSGQGKEPGSKEKGKDEPSP